MLPAVNLARRQRLAFESKMSAGTDAVYELAPAPESFSAVTQAPSSQFWDDEQAPSSTSAGLPSLRFSRPEAKFEDASSTFQDLSITPKSGERSLEKDLLSVNQNDFQSVVPAKPGLDTLEDEPTAQTAAIPGLVSSKNLEAGRALAAGQKANSQQPTDTLTDDEASRQRAWMFQRMRDRGVMGEGGRGTGGASGGLQARNTAQKVTDDYGQADFQNMFLAPADDALDLTLNNGSFGTAVPAFGNFDKNDSIAANSYSSTVESPRSEVALGKSATASTQPLYSVNEVDGDVPYTVAVPAVDGLGVEQADKTTVRTRVTAPDGGKILLGGILKTNESGSRGGEGKAAEANSPTADNGRFDINTADATSPLMMTVTPHVIIQEEDEVRYADDTRAYRQVPSPVGDFAVQQDDAEAEVVAKQVESFALESTTGSLLKSNVLNAGSKQQVEKDLVSAFDAVDRATTRVDEPTVIKTWQALSNHRKERDGDVATSGKPTEIADFDSLQSLVEKTVDPDSFQRADGKYPPNLSIVVSAPQDGEDKKSEIARERLEPFKESSLDADGDGSEFSSWISRAENEESKPGSPKEQSSANGNGLFGDVQVEFIEEPNKVIMRGSKPDVERTLEVIDQVKGLPEADRTKQFKDHSDSSGKDSKKFSAEDIPASAGVAKNNINSGEGRVIDLRELEKSERRIKASQIFEIPKDELDPKIDVRRPIDEELQEFEGESNLGRSVTINGTYVPGLRQSSQERGGKEAPSPSAERDGKGSDGKASETKASKLERTLEETRRELSLEQAGRRSSVVPNTELSDAKQQANDKLPKLGIAGEGKDDAAGLAHKLGSRLAPSGTNELSIRDQAESTVVSRNARTPLQTPNSAPPKDTIFAYDARVKAPSPQVAPNAEVRNTEKSAATDKKSIDEQSASKEPFSTFSLHVSDVAFKLAQTALSQGQWPEAAKIRIEEFVNALDYHDQLPTGNQKVACRVEQAIHPFMMQRNLLRVSMRTAATGRSQNTPLRLTLLLDNSGSMERPDRRQAVLRAFQALTQQLSDKDQITLISFASTPRLLADKVPGNQGETLLQLVENLPSEGGTNIEAALMLAREKAAEQQVAGAQNRIVLLTDGAVNLGNANPESLAKLVTGMRDAGIAFDAAGISAQDLNDEVLEALTRQGDGRYYLLDSAESIGEKFAAQIAGALRPSAQNVKVQVEFNPQRVGRYKLLGFEKHRLNKEDFRNDKVDAAEMAAAEAGVAVYQYEIKSNGTGDVGSVSVRFRDVSTGKMIENRWPIPYESNSPRLEQAEPSMQLAASAAMLAARLSGGPLGDSVDLTLLQKMLAKLPEQCTSQPRVQQLRTMVEQAIAIAARLMR